MYFRKKNKRKNVTYSYIVIFFILKKLKYYSKLYIYIIFILPILQFVNLV